MKENMNVTEDNVENEENSEWAKTHVFPAYDNILPIINSMILLIEGEKKRTLEKIEETKKILEKLNR